MNGVDGANADDPTAWRPPFDALSTILQKWSGGNRALSTTAVATPAMQVLLEFVVEHIREPSGGKSDAGEGYPFCIVSVVAGQRERAGSVSDRRVYVDGLLGDAEALVNPHGLVLYGGLRWIS